MDIIYGGNTISFFGAEGVLYFANNSSPEGLPRIRYAHLAICIPSLEWNQAKQKRTVIDAVQCLNSRMTSLCQLDVEVALTEGQPPQPELFWAWLREVLGQLRGLDRLVLKVSVLHPEHPPSRGIADEESPRLKRLELDRNEFYNGKWTPNMEPLVTWNEYEYGLLKNEVGQPRLAE
ncbi:hypothetical protein BGW36DRAFT_382652 [Talaromyces proteolyticus]|uniref:Uncharacterized protein n=1 Tax=Talaromyces proteolyticus TaxID=1131652 RepID=A0AAD4KNF4_9EURO|nr:uncharacterized protein BGW36DRAFT_382652 [Talaromyces proteolyticus]KAH8695409.1 hypothetical protein BGW36DRAFT_382652 [Talaromyces proteolyticus]